VFLLPPRERCDGSIAGRLAIMHGRAAAPPAHAPAVASPRHDAIDAWSVHRVFMLGAGTIALA